MFSLCKIMKYIQVFECFIEKEGIDHKSNLILEISETAIVFLF